MKQDWSNSSFWEYSRRKSPSVTFWTKAFNAILENPSQVKARSPSATTSLAFQERMKPQVAGPESIHRVVDGNMLEKLKLTFPKARPRGCNRLKPSCGTVKRLLECVGALLAFHLLSVAVALAGVVAVAVLLVGLLGGAIKLLLGIMPIRYTMLFDATSGGENCYFNVVTTVCATLLVASIVNIICALVVSSILVLWCASGALLFNLAFPLISALLRIDVQLANYISSTLRFASVPVNVPQPEEHFA
jgi:hypothetical protein